MALTSEQAQLFLNNRDKSEEEEFENEQNKFKEQRINKRQAVNSKHYPNLKWNKNILYGFDNTISMLFIILLCYLKYLY